VSQNDPLTPHGARLG